MNSRIFLIANKYIFKNKGQVLIANALSNLGCIAKYFQGEMQAYVSIACVGMHLLFAHTNIQLWVQSNSTAYEHYESESVLIVQSCLILCDPMDGIAHQAPLSMEFSRKDY